jgi:uncharacterized protein involved in outer membrane biogenesis
MRKWILRGLVVFFLLLFASLAGFIYFIRQNYSPENIRLELERELTRRSRMQVSIGALRFTWTGNLQITEVCIRNPQMQTKRCVAKVASAYVDLKLLPLLRKRIEVSKATARNVVVALFTESQKSSVGTKKLINSWEIPKDTSDVHPQDILNGNLVLTQFEITEGVIEHEVPVLPIPLGENKFALALAPRAEPELSGKLLAPGGASIDWKLAIKTTDILRMLKLGFLEHRLDGADSISGEFNCNAWNTLLIDPRLRSVSGNWKILMASSNLKLETRAGKLDILSPLRALYDFVGSVDLDVPAQKLSQLNGTVSTTGLSVELVKFSRQNNLTTGNVSIAANLAVAPLGFAAPMTGQLTASGQWGDKGLTGNFRINGFTLGANAAMKIESPAIVGSFGGNNIYLQKQHLLVAGQPAVATITVQALSGATTVTGSLHFDALNLDKFATGASNGGNVSASRGTGISPQVNLSLTARSIAYGPWTATQFKTNATVSGGEIQLAQMSMAIARGIVSGSFVRKSHGQSVVSFVARNLKAQDLSPVLGLKGTVFSNLNGDGNFTFSGKSFAEARSTITGSFNLTLGRGKVKDSFFQKGIFNGPLHKLEEKFSDIEFASGNATVQFNAGSVRARRVFFDAEEWNVTMRIEADANWAGKATMDFRFKSSFLENVANPLHMGIQGRLENEFYTLPFACRGNVISGACYKKNW